MADVNRGNRPLSPFMIGQYYRPQMTSISSIVVRITGLIALGAALLVVAWLLCAASSEVAFNVINGLLTSWLGDFVMIAAAWCLWYHLLGCIRHTIWDFGFCIEVDISEKMGWGMFIGATILTVITAIVV